MQQKKPQFFRRADSVIRDKYNRGSLMDVILPVTELDRANAIFERILYTLPPEPERKPARELQQGRGVFQPERQAPERKEPEQKGRQEQAKPSREVSRQPAQQGRQEAPVPRRQASTPKKDSRSERDSRATKTSSSICRESGASRGTSERPSVEARLKAHQAQMRKPSVPARAKSREKIHDRAK